MKKLALIGCGGIGTYHLGHLLQFRDIVDLVGFCDLIPEKAEKFAEQAGGNARAFTDFKVMYDEVRPDIVFICVPPYCHGEIEYETIRRGIHFFCEKPVALDLSLAKDIRDRAAKAGIITATGFQCRYSNLVEPTNEFIKKHPTVFIDCVRVGGVPGAPWWKNKNISGGQIVEQTVHQFDLIRYHHGDPVQVMTYGARGYITEVPNYNTDDVSTTIAKFADGSIACISTGCYATSGEAFDGKITFSARDSRADLYILGNLKVYGTNDEAAEDEGENTAVIKGDGNLKRSEGGAVVYSQEGDAGVLCDRTFIEGAIKGDGSKIRSPYADAVKTLAFVLACNQSMGTGKPVDIDYD